jgi:hypothetical protein
VHAVRLQKARNLTAEIEERSDVPVLPNDVNVKVTPRHQADGVAANDVHFTVLVENRLKARSQDVGGSDLLAVCRHVRRSIGSDAAFVVFRLSAVRRAAAMARMLRDARVPEELFFPGNASRGVWLTVKGLNVAAWQETGERSTS